MRIRFTTAAAALVFAGCSIGRPAPELAWAPEAPPPDRAEIPGPPDEPGKAWVAGGWVREEGGWRWQSGRYSASPGANAVWVPGSWIEKDGQWARLPGSWR